MTQWFFSYGSSADPEEFRKEVGAISAFAPATVAGHGLTFVNHRAEWGGGTSCVVPAPGQDVIGTAYALDAAQLALVAEADATYGLVDLVAHIDGAERPVRIMQPHEIGAFAPPSDAYVARIRTGLAALYPLAQVDPYLKRALRRDQLFSGMLGQWDAQAVIRDEYNTRFRRLLPWRNTIRTPWGGAWATVEPGNSSALYVHDEEEVALVISGHGRLRVDDEERAVGKGDFVYFPPLCEHVLTNTSDTDLEVLFLWWGGAEGVMWAGHRI